MNIFLKIFQEVQVEFLHKFPLVFVYLEGFWKQNEYQYYHGPQNSTEKDISFARFL